VTQQQKSSGCDHNDWPEKSAKVEFGQFFNQKERTSDDQDYSPENVSKVHGYNCLDKFL
jgi:hypothetical protein